MRHWIALFLIILAGEIHSQVLPVDTIPAAVDAQIDSNKAFFKASLRDLRQIAGAPAPFYTYFWEFGDGHFSFEKNPAHHYRDTGIYDVRVYATNNYDDGKPPPTKPKKVTISKVAPTQLAGINFFKGGGNVELKTNRMPKPAEEMIVIVGYRNKAEWNMPNMSGKLLILYNEKQFRQNNFVLNATRNYHGEQKTQVDDVLAYVPLKKIEEEDWKQKGGPASTQRLEADENSTIIKDKTALFRNAEVWKFGNLKAGEERFMFLSVNTTPEMIQDTNAVVTISAVFIPDEPLVEPEVIDLQLQIVASHDPNKMMLKNRMMNYRFTSKKRELTYRVRFQNTGQGPAKRVAIGVRTASVLDLSTLKVTGMQPQCIPCKEAYQNQSCIDTVMATDSVAFIFKNIYLPGMKQKGVSDADSTMGFVEYTVRFKKKPRKVPFASRASIVFDKNEPILTNRSVGRFTPGFSPAIIAVYGSQAGTSQEVKLGNKNFSLGLSLAPFAPHRKFLQWEIYASSFNETETYLGRKPESDTTINQIPYIFFRNSYRTTRTTLIDAVPLQLRYNLNSFIGVGAGTMVSVNLSTTNEVRAITTLINKDASETELLSSYKEGTQRFDQWKTSLFADIQLGRVRVGPSIGFRYYHSLNSKYNRFSSYLTWKF